jgi:hypothetical protein
MTRVLKQPPYAPHIRVGAIGILLSGYFRGIFAVRELVETIVVGGRQTGLAISNHDAQRGVAD